MPQKYQNKYRVDSQRFQFWDYSAPGSYFITVCVAGGVNVLGKVVGKEIELFERGEIVKNEILEIHNYHDKLKLDSWQIMPNHIHLLLTIEHFNDEDEITEFSVSLPNFWNQKNYPQNPTPEDLKRYRLQRRKMLIPKTIGKFKTKSSKQINKHFKTPGWSNWQSNYYDHIVRNEEYFKIRNYIINNPNNWRRDKFFNSE